MLFKPFTRESYLKGVQNKVGGVGGGGGRAPFGKCPKGSSFFLGCSPLNCDKIKRQFEITEPMKTYFWDPNNLA